MPTYRIKYGNSRIDGGLFLKQKSATPIQYKYIDGRGEAFRHLSTFSGRSTIKESIIDLLKKSKNHVFFTSFLIQDEQIIETLIDTAKRLKGHLYVLTTLKNQDFDAIASLEDQINEDEWNFREHIKCIQELVRNGISVKARKDCHAKFVATDDKYAIVTSANSVPTCFTDIPQKSGRVRRANPENGILIEIPSEVERLSNFFRYIWRSAYNYYVPPDSNVFEINEFSNDILPINSNEPDRYSELGHIVWTAPDDHRILNSFLEMIDSAEESICICSWVLKGIDGHMLSDKLIEAAKRGIKIEILLRGMYRQDHLESCYFLKKKLGEQLQILGDYCNHAKAALIDNKEAMIMTSNIDSLHGLNNSVEVGFLSNEPDFIESVSNFLSQLKIGCELEFVCNPTQNQAAQGFSTLRQPILTGNVCLDVSPKCKDRDLMIKKFMSEIQNELIRVSIHSDKNQRIRLLTKNIIVDCSNHSNRLNALDISETASASNMYFQQILPETTIEINVS